MLMHLHIRQFGYRLMYCFRPSESLKGRLAMYRAAVKWNTLLDPIKFVEHGTEPQIEQGTSHPAS
jgi:hypothetical protein